MKVVPKNPVYPQDAYNYQGDKKATYFSVVLKILLLIALTITAGYGTYKIADNNTTVIDIIIWLGVMPLLAYSSFKFALKIEPLKSVFVIIYTLSQGAFIGYATAMYSKLSGSGTAYIILISSLSVLLVMLFIYLIKPFREQDVPFKAVSSIFLGIAVSLMGSLLLDSLEIIYDFDSYMSLMAFVCFFSVIFYTVDFDRVITLVEADAPKHNEWNLALGILITIVFNFVRVILVVINIIENASKNKKKRN